MVVSRVDSRTNRRNINQTVVKHFSANEHLTIKFKRASRYLLCQPMIGRRCIMDGMELCNVLIIAVF